VIPKQVPPEAGPNSSMVTYYSIQSNYPVRRKFDYPVLDIGFSAHWSSMSPAVPKTRSTQANTLLRSVQRRYLDCKGHEHGSRSYTTTCSIRCRICAK